VRIGYHERFDCRPKEPAMTRLPTYFVSHGGGPWPWMKDQYGPTYDKLEASLVDIKRQVGVRPKAVLVVTSHWETDEFTVSAARRPA
jgi:aromatic ring-opening dioxygenase catalytic subunit (LigB family)